MSQTLQLLQSLPVGLLLIFETVRLSLGHEFSLLQQIALCMTLVLFPLSPFLFQCFLALSTLSCLASFFISSPRTAVEVE